MNENVKNLLQEQVWFVATCGEQPNVIPVGFKAVLEDGKLAVGDVFMKETYANVRANGKVAISVCNATTAEAYQIKGSAVYVTDGPVYEMFQTMAQATFQGAANAKGAIVITPEKIIVSTPGTDNHKFV